ncbi:hypothetical protein OE88DRAFT_1661966 [Heliocybe sulcata]|uniref:Uncharacterized protein n=1 Tax=Heliocybe sulcata TaxID=5364 RepID=A0A5C3MX87_9AGAM|nr:hypothetical protein OE88DRAFT_1661966 [Heliocybe sulcata]
MDDKLLASLSRNAAVYEGIFERIPYAIMSTEPFDSLTPFAVSCLAESGHQYRRRIRFLGHPSNS